MTQRMAEVARWLRTWASAEVRTLGELEQQTVQLAKEVGNVLFAGVCQLAAPATLAPQSTCRCGQQASSVRHRPAHVLTVLGAIVVTRPSYYCAHGHRGPAPLDQRLQRCAGSTSAGLDELLAVLGAKEDSFAEVLAVLDKLTLVRVCSNLARTATERLGQARHRFEQQTVAAAWAGEALPPPATPPPARRYVSLAGVLVHPDAGWNEDKLGTGYPTITQAPRDRPDKLVLRTQESSVGGDCADPHSVGQRRWGAAARRGVLNAAEVVVIGDGAHWIWNLAAEHFPEARQIVDWYQATQYVWQVAGAVYGEGTERANQWAKARLDELWEGQGADVLAAFQAHAGAGPPVQEALTYCTNHQARRRDPEYRARGIQIGSGAIERGGHPVIGARLKQAGMSWQVAGARAVATRVSRALGQRHVPAELAGGRGTGRCHGAHLAEERAVAGGHGAPTTTPPHLSACAGLT